MIGMLPPWGAFALPLALLLQPVVSDDYTTTNNTTPHDNNKDCGCYVVSSGADSNTPEYFQYYRFYDFRNLAEGPGQYTKAPPLINNTQNAGEESVWDADVLNSDAWNVDWGIQNWSKPSTEDFPIPMVNSPANVYLLQNDDANNAFTYLTLRTSRLDDFQSAGEIENEQKNLMHCSMRMYGRVSGSKGAVAGFFTFYDDDNESDIEILTNDATDVIRYTNQPSVDKEGNEVQVASVAPTKLPRWDDWQTHRIDWLPKNSYWFLDGNQVAANTYSVPRIPSYLVMNMWSDGGTWSGNMSVGDSAEFHIQWIELIFNTSGPVEGPGGSRNDKRSMDLLEKRKAKGCEVVCKVDGVKQIGTPEVVSVNKSAAPGMMVPTWVVLFIGAVGLWVGL
ncbi:glycoside hydrolase family 16 protein [Melanomma pulvis-pyrius CBS 109.77]|uniref:Glycoside hydrolase family 16 protein n=1 Tax=Melanomma pulvis-pyrius CBS 109.77 TaxID=1314802 RepID=A0A6A6X2Q6_9PLEO|nr:glycoside hydrolase family 16 protein [Melanomma pulvis-pyrius CBS 109.77]